MAVRRTTFRQSDIARVLAAAHKAGCQDVRIEIEGDRLSIITGKAAAVGPVNSFDKLMGRT